MVKLRPIFCALGVLTTSASFAQTQISPVAPPPAGEPGVPPPGTPALISPIAPAPIDPPIEVAPDGQQPVAPIDPMAPAPVTVSPTATRLNEFQGDEIGLVLRTLARQAKMNLVVSEKVIGTVTLRLEDKTPKEAIEVIVASKGLIMDELGGVFYVKTKEERASEPTESASYTLNYATAEKILPLLKTQLQSGTTPDFDQRTNTLFYREAKSNLGNILLFLETVDQPTQQVMIEARLVEVTANPRQNYGINWGGVLGGSTPQTIRYGGSTIASATVKDGVPVLDKLPGVVTDEATGRLRGQDFLFGGGGGGNPFGLLGAVGGQFAILSAPQLSVTLRMLNEDADAEFLANPRVVTANNTKATIKITRAQPVPQLNFNEQTAQAVFSGFQDKEFGNTLIVTPVINKDGFVSLQVQPEISNKVGDATFTFAGSVVSSPIIDKRTLDSNVLIKSGDTLAIGGLLQDEITKGRAKVPFLGDIPVIGYAFQERTNNRVKRNLLIFVTPTVIQQGYGTGLESQVSGIHHSGDEFADPNGWRNNAKGAARLVPTSNRQTAADIPAPGLAPAPKRVSTSSSRTTRSK